MLLRKRKSRIYYLRQFFEYPIQLTQTTLVQLGLARTLRIGFSYLRSMLFPQKEHHRDLPRASGYIRAVGGDRQYHVDSLHRDPVFSGDRPR